MPEGMAPNGMSQGLAGVSGQGPPKRERGIKDMSSAVVGLIILVVCVVLFLTEWIPNSVTACLGCTMMVLLNVCSFDEVFSSFSNSIVVLMVGAMVVGIAMFDTGVAQLVGRSVIRCSKGSGRLFLLIGGLVAGILSMFLANTAIIAAFLPIIDSVCRVSPEMRRKDLCLPIACAAMYGGASTLIGCTPQLTANGLMEQMVGIQMGMWDLTRPGLCLLVLYLLYIQIMGYRRGQKLWGNRPEETMDLDQAAVRSVMESKPDRKKLVIMSIIVVLMIVFYAGAWISTAMTAVCAALLCIILGCCDAKSVIKQMNWDCVLFLGGCLGLANGFTASGAGNLITEWVSGLLGDMVSPMFLFAVLVLLTLLISQFITNSTAIIITLPVAFSLCQVYGYSLMPFCLGITLGASIACSTPLAAAQIAMTQVAGYKFSDYFRYTWPMSLISYLGILIFVPLFYPLV